MPKRVTCQVCERRVGSTKDRCGEEDGVPLGPLEKCDLCSKWVCPDCLHEADCCFDGDSEAAPPGWRVSKEGPRGYVEYERIEE